MITRHSPAKVNLFLKIIRRRSDGYHELASLFQTVNLCDTLSFSRRGQADRLRCTDPSVPVDDKNLVMKALNLFRKRTELDFYVDIAIDKKIPSQAGLGGGSSNAATTLWAMNEMAGQPASLAELQQWGMEIGSDVPFFLSGGTAYCRGRGEIIQQLPPLASALELVLAKPSFGMSTPEVYRNVEGENLSPRDAEADLKHFLEGEWIFYNDLEAPAFRACPELAAFKESLQADYVLLSGSGSAFFCIGKCVTVPSEAWQVKVSTINREEGAWYSPNVNQEVGA